MSDLIRKTEKLGQSVDQGLIGRDEAIQQLVEFSDGGLTKVGASDMVDNWRGVRAKYERARNIARDGLNEQLRAMCD